jgi:N-methylhydantoinase B
VHVGISGGAGTPVTDGFLSIIHAGNAGMCRIDSVEVDELQYPMRVVRRGILPDTEGAGTFRGAPSVYAEFGPTTGCSMKVLYTADGTISNALGARGGGGGGPTRALKREQDGTLTMLPPCYGVALEPGEFVVSYSSGGGGYGAPFERDPERVMHDLREGWITPERASTVYGVVAQGRTDDDTLHLDADATRAHRGQTR